MLNVTTAVRQPMALGLASGSRNYTTNFELYSFHTSPPFKGLTVERFLASEAAYSSEETDLITGAS